MWIFDYLREQISKESWLCKPRTNGHYSDDAVFVEDAMKVITEAEAKWEAEEKEKPFTVGIDVHKQVMWERDTAIEQLHELGYGLGEKPRESDCCEWQYNDFEEKWETSCGVLFKLHDSDKEITNFCPYCGNHIKISEVKRWED